MKKILILAANPKDTHRLRLDEEVQEIKEGMRRSKKREQFEIQTEWAIGLRDLRRALLDSEPQIVHFCGHSKIEGLMVEDEQGHAVLASVDALTSLFESFADTVECVLLNACYSEQQARAINQHIPYVIGMTREIHDKAALEFAVGFYDALGAGKSFEQAFKLGCNGIQLYGIPEHLTPVLLTQDKDKRVVISYKRNAQPDEKLLQLLESGLKARGHRVFIDRHIKPGLEWARQITEEIEQADALVVLLSPASVQSEMVASEVEIAHQSAQKHQGKPRLLPVRIDFEEPLPQDLSGKLDHLQYILWRGSEDDRQLVIGVLEGLTTPLQNSQSERSNLEMVGGAVPLDSKFYVVRSADEEFQTAISRQDSIVLIKGARQIGKTSLLARGLQTARASGLKIALTDFQKLNTAHLQSLESFYLTLGEMLTDQLDLDVYPQDIWKSRRSPNANFERFLCREVLTRVEKPLLWAMDEVDRLFNCDFGSEVFALFRAWHNERALNPDGEFSQLTLAIAYATEAHLFIQDLNQSPFNVGTRLYLTDFTFEQVADLNQRHGSPLRKDRELQRFYRLVGGQPYLVRRGLNEIVSQGVSIDDFTTKAAHDDGPFDDHLRRILVLLARGPNLCEAVRSILHGKPCPDFETFYRLRSAGILSGESKDDARPRCELYAVYLKKHLG